MTKRESMLIDKAIEQEYYKAASGYQIDIMDISKFYAGARAALIDGKSIEEAVSSQVLLYCRKSI